MRIDKPWSKTPQLNISTPGLLHECVLEAETLAGCSRHSVQHDESIYLECASWRLLSEVVYSDSVISVLSYTSLFRLLCPCHMFRLILQQHDFIIELKYIIVKGISPTY